MGETVPRSVGWRIGWTLAGFAPYVAVTAVHLASKFGRDIRVDRVSKALEMPTLAFGAGVAILLAHRRPPRLVTALLFTGLALSWLGDIYIERLALGMGLFFAAHVAYIWMFETAFPDRAPSRWGLLAIPWFLAQFVVLAPRAGAMMPLVVLYGLILAAMAVSSSRGNASTTAGGVLFLVSDTVLSLRLFTGLFQTNLSRFVIMLSYTAAQWLIASGMVRAESATYAGSGIPARLSGAT